MVAAMRTVLFISLFLLTSNTGSNFTIFAQDMNDNTDSPYFVSTNTDVNTNTSDSNNNITSANNINSFNMEGTITSIVRSSTADEGVRIIPNYNISPVANSSISPLQTNILGGKWRIAVVKENVEYFKANITMTTSNGTYMHNHLIEFKPHETGTTTLLPNNTAIISPNPDPVEIAALNFSQNDKNVTSISRANGSIAFSGVADIITNGVIAWRDVPTSASIFNNNVLNIRLDPKSVNDHFSDMPIFGLVDSIEPNSSPSVICYDLNTTYRAS
jgi:hypothetical protein